MEDPLVQWIFFSTIKQLLISCEKLADYLLVKGGVVLLLGIADGKFRDGYLRLFYIHSIENIRLYISRIKKSDPSTIEILFE
ncbi:MAG: hypothetical protein SWX82_20000 [Cyanobacteriota bacterium]|nr:hypothetical protein [Cyanobacteriota bacterium]